MSPRRVLPPTPATHDDDHLLPVDASSPQALWQAHLPTRAKPPPLLPGTGGPGRVGWEPNPPGLKGSQPGVSHPPQASSQGVRFLTVTQLIDPASLPGRGGVAGRAKETPAQRPQDGAGREDRGQPAGRDQGPAGSDLPLLRASLKLRPESDVTPF